MIAQTARSTRPDVKPAGVSVTPALASGGQRSGRHERSVIPGVQTK
jgi:hypothetical protein